MMTSRSIRWNAPTSLAAAVLFLAVASPQDASATAMFDVSATVTVTVDTLQAGQDVNVNIFDTWSDSPMASSLMGDASVNGTHGLAPLHIGLDGMADSDAGTPFSGAYASSEAAILFDIFNAGNVNQGVLISFAWEWSASVSVDHADEQAGFSVLSLKTIAGDGIVFDPDVFIFNESGEGQDQGTWIYSTLLPAGESRTLDVYLEITNAFAESEYRPDPTVPEPSTLALMAGGIAAVGLRRRRRRL